MTNSLLSIRSRSVDNPVDARRDARKLLTVLDRHTARCAAVLGMLATAIILAVPGSTAYAQVDGTFAQMDGEGLSGAIDGAGSVIDLGSDAPDGRETIGLDEIERGMVGYGASVFAGSELRRFDVEVVGKLENLEPGLSFIMARLYGQNLEESGVVAGMSGSPVFLDGRLAGAVAFSWNFSNGALAGITPIGAMRQLSDLPISPGPAGSGGSNGATISSGVGGRAAALGTPGPLAGDADLAPVVAGDFRSLLERSGSREELARWMSLAFQDAGRSPASDAAPALQTVTVGFSPNNRALLEQAAGWRSVQSGGRAVGADLPALRTGGPVAVLLVGGDLQMAVNGTITERRGDEILAFGHPYLGLGPVRLPMAKAEVVTIVSSRLSSFKLSNVGEVVGAFDEDRETGMRGYLGMHAPTTPMRVEVRHPREGDQTFDLEIADLQQTRPTLIAVSVLQCIERAVRNSGDAGMDLSAEFRLAGREPLHIRQSFDGSGAAIDAAIYLLQVVAFLELNDWVDVEVEGIDVAVDVADSIRTQEIERAFADQREVRPGETVQVHLELRDYRGDRRSMTVPYTLDADTRSGPRYLFVGDGASVDAARLRIAPRTNRSFDEAADQLERLRSTKDLVVMEVDVQPGVVGEGGALPALPASMVALWKGSSANQVKGVRLAVAGEQTHAMNDPVSGVARIDLQVLPTRGGR